MRAPNKANLSRVRAAAGKAGAALRWGEHKERAMSCLRVYPRTAAAIRARAKREGKYPADVVAALVGP